MIDNDAALALRTRDMAAALWGRIKAMPMAASGAINAIATVMEPKKLVLLNPAREFVEIARARTDPARIDIVVSDPADVAILLGIPTDRPAGDDTGSVAYLCNGPVCLPPIREASALEDALKPVGS